MKIPSWLIQKHYGTLVSLVVIATFAGGLALVAQVSRAQIDQPEVSERGLPQVLTPGTPPAVKFPPQPSTQPANPPPPASSSGPQSVPYALMLHQENAFLKIGAIKGNATTLQFLNQIVFQNMSYGVQQAAEWEEGDRLSGRITTFADLTVVKEMDSASPFLAQACATKEQFPKAEIALISGKDTYFKLTLEGVIVSSVSVRFHSGEAKPMETVTLKYRKATWEWGTTKASYDLRQNAKV